MVQLDSVDAAVKEAITRIDRVDNFTRLEENDHL
jgi:hypothetical protein